jgi:hypothetical protein
MEVHKYKEVFYQCDVIGLDSSWWLDGASRSQMGRRSYPGPADPCPGLLRLAA